MSEKKVIVFIVEGASEEAAVGRIQYNEDYIEAKNVCDQETE